MVPRSPRRGDPALPPERLAAEACRALEAAADPRVAAQARRYFKPGEQVPVLGVGSRALRQVERALWQQVRDAWTYAQAVSACEHLLASACVEPKAVGILLLARHADVFERSLLDRARAWLERGLCDSWAVTDVLSQRLVAPLLERHPSLVARILRWGSEPSRWVRRASAVAMARLAARGERLDEAYRLAGRLRTDGDHLVEKALGWLLRDAGRTQPRRLESYLVEHGRRLPRTAVRYALERCPPGDRRRLLAATRAAPPSRGG